MTKLRLTFSLLLGLITLVLLGWSFVETNPNNELQSTNNQSNNTAYTADKTATRVYDPNGHLEYKLTAEKVIHHAVDELSSFSLPELIIYNISGQQNWSLKSNQAVIRGQDNLSLSNNVVLKRLEAKSLLEQLTTENALINLNNFDISSDDKINIKGDGLLSEGIGLRGNLKKETAELMENAVTQYFKNSNQ